MVVEHTGSSRKNQKTQLFFNYRAIKTLFIIAKHRCKKHLECCICFSNLTQYMAVAKLPLLSFKYKWVRNKMLNMVLVICCNILHTGSTKKIEVFECYELL